MKNIIFAFWMNGHCQLAICFDMFCHWSLGQLPLMFLFGVASLRRCYSYRHLGDALLSQRFELQATFSFKLALTSCQHLSPNRLSTLKVRPHQLESTHLLLSTYDVKRTSKDSPGNTRSSEKIKMSENVLQDKFGTTLRKLWETWRQPWDNLRQLLDNFETTYGQLWDHVVTI